MAAGTQIGTRRVMSASAVIAAIRISGVSWWLTTTAR